MANPKPHCSVDYHNFSGANLDTKAHLVSEGIYTHNPPFTAPPSTQAIFDALVADHHEKYEAYKNGGKAQKGPYNTARAALVTAMDNTGDYVDAIPGVNDDMILLGGYTPTKTGETQTLPPPVPIGIKLSLGVTGEMFAECDAIPGDIFYGCFTVAGEPIKNGLNISAGQITFYDNQNNPAAAMPPQLKAILDLNKSRKKHFTGLTKGVEYYFYFFAVNNAGVSQLSEVKYLMCG